MSEKYGFNNEGALPVSEIFYSNDENELEGALQKDAVQADAYIGSLNSRLKIRFNAILTDRKASLEAVEDGIDTAKGYIQEVTDTRETHGDPDDRLKKIIKVLEKKLKKLEEKAEEIARKEGVAREERVPEEAGTPEVITDDTEAEVLPAPKEGEDTAEGLIDLAAPIATAAFVGSNPDVDPAIIGAAVEPDMIKEESKKGKGVIRAIRDNAEKSTTKLTEQSTKSAEDGEARESKEEIKIEDLVDISIFLKKLPKKKNLTAEEAQKILSDTERVLDQVSEEAKRRGKVEINNVIVLVEEFKDLLVSGDIHETVVTNLMQDLGKKFGVVTKALGHTLSRKKKAEDEIKEHIEKRNLKELNIDHNDGIALFKELTESLNNEFDQAEAKGVHELESYLTELKDLNEKVQSSLASETDVNKQKLTQRFADQLVKRIEQTTILIGKRKTEQKKANMNPTPTLEVQKDTEPSAEQSIGETAEFDRLFVQAKAGGVVSFRQYLNDTESLMQHLLDSNLKETDEARIKLRQQTIEKLTRKIEYATELLAKMEEEQEKANMNPTPTPEITAEQNGDEVAEFAQLIESLDKKLERAKDISELRIYLKDAESFKQHLQDSQQFETSQKRIDFSKKLIEKLAENIEQAIKLIAEMEKGNETNFTTIAGLSNYIRNTFPTAPENVKELSKMREKIVAVLENEYQATVNKDKHLIEEMQATLASLSNFLESLTLSGPKEKFVADTVRNFKSYSNLFEKTNNKNTTPAKDKDPEPEPTPAPEPTLDTEAPQTKRGIEDIVDFGDITNPSQASETIRTDEGFNIWLNTINERGYDGGIRTIEDWHKEYSEQKASIDKIKEIFKKSEVEKAMFEGFKNKEEREQAKKIHIKELELAYLTDPLAKEKVEKIIAGHEATIIQAEKIKKLEEERERLEKEYKGKKLKMSEEVVFKALYGKEAEIMKVSQLLGFLTDMEHNYKYYRGSIKKEGTPNELSEMFGLYDLSRKHPTEDKEEKISWGKRLLAKVRHQFFDTDNDYDYRKEFKEKIQVLRDAGLVETKKVDEDTAHDNMFKLKRLAEEIAQGVENGLTIEEALAESEEEPSKELFNKVFPKFIEAIANNEKLQTETRDRARRTNLFTGIDAKIATEKGEAINLEKLFMAEAVGSQSERDEFTTMVRQELTGQKLDTLANKLRTKKADAKTLEQLAVQFAEISEDDAESSLYKRVTMLLYTEEVRLSASIKEINIAPNSIKKWAAILANEDVSKKEKTDYIENMLKLLKEKYTKLSKPKDTVDRIGVTGFIKYFEDKKSQFK